jgi:inhibitor of KinA sporulation pathway (predicted exonuclease)
MRRLDRIVVVDVEATCWEGEPPPGEESEIIEIGVCLLDTATAERVERVGFLVRPVSSSVGPFCTRLTTLTQAEVDRGVSLEEGCRALRQRFRTQDRVWASYGDYDRRQFERQCRRDGVAYPFGTSHINVKTLFAVAHGLSREVGMAEALERIGIPLEGTHHRGADDAWNIAAILGRIITAARRGGSPGAAGLIRPPRPGRGS